MNRLAKMDRLTKLVNGSIAMAEAVKLAKTDVVSGFPITPQTLIIEHLSDLKNNGKFEGEFVPVESEHSAPSTLIGASKKGCRTFTASASQGILLMSEVLYNLAGLRVPTVMGVSNRSVSAPLNIHNDQQDSISQRDSGWMQLYVSNNQMALDGTLFACRIAEDSNVMLPAMVCMDGFTLSHLIEPVTFPEQSLVDKFLPEFSPKSGYVLDSTNPLTLGYAALQNDYMPTRKQLQEAMKNALPVIEKATKEFENIFGRKSPRLIDAYKSAHTDTEKAEIVLVSTGSAGELIREVIDSYQGDVPLGHLDLQFYRPFPAERVREVLKKARMIGVVERNISLGHFGAVAADLSIALQGLEKPLQDYIVGLGGQNIGPAQVHYMIDNLVRCLKTGKTEQEPLWVDYETPVEDQYQQSFADLNKGRKNIIFNGRGGQGAYTGATLSGKVAFAGGKCTQAFPTFGPEREGAPLKAYVRISESPEKSKGRIGDRSQVDLADLVIVLDPSLMAALDVRGQLAEGGLLMVNDRKESIEYTQEDGSAKILLNASAIAERYLKENFPNTPLVGAAAKYLGVERNILERAIGENMPKKTKENVAAALHAYDEMGKILPMLREVGE